MAPAVSQSTGPAVTALESAGSGTKSQRHKDLTPPRPLGLPRTRASQGEAAGLWARKEITCTILKLAAPTGAAGRWRPGKLILLQALCAAAVVALMLVGCAASNLQQQPPTETAGEVGPAPYRIKIGDTLDVRFYNSPELNIEQVPVRNDGKISLELVGDVQAAGLEPAELSRKLTGAYASELTNPRVTVILRRFGGQVYVDGEVRTPSPVPIGTGLTTAQAISSAGGFTDRARRDSVVLIRRVEGSYRGYRLPLNKVVSGEDFSYDIALQDSDILYVPKSKIANVNLFIDQYIRQTLPVSPAMFAF